MLIMTTTATVTTTLSRPPTTNHHPVVVVRQRSPKRVAGSCKNAQLLECQRNCNEDDDHHVASVLTRTPMQRNWVLSDNFYLLESPKTWREKQRSRTAQRLLGHEDPVSFDVTDERRVTNACATLSTGPRYRQRRFDHQLKAASRSLRNLRDFRDEEEVEMNKKQLYREGVSSSVSCWRWCVVLRRDSE